MKKLFIIALFSVSPLTMAADYPVNIQDNFQQSYNNNQTLHVWLKAHPFLYRKLLRAKKEMMPHPAPKVNPAKKDMMMPDNMKTTTMEEIKTSLPPALATFTLRIIDSDTLVSTEYNSQRINFQLTPEDIISNIYIG